MCAIFLSKLLKVWWDLICQESESNCTTASISNSRRDASRQLPPGLTQPTLTGNLVPYPRESNGCNVIFGRKIYLCYWNQHILKPLNCQALLRQKTDSHLVKMKRKDEHLAQQQQTERTVQQPCYDSTFSESCSAEWKNVPQQLLPILCSQIVHILLNSPTAPLTSWSQIIPLKEITVSDSFPQAA